MLCINFLTHALTC